MQQQKMLLLILHNHYIFLTLETAKMDSYRNHDSNSKLLKSNLTIFFSHEPTVFHTSACVFPTQTAFFPVQ